jgi:chorismate mutase
MLVHNNKRPTLIAGPCSAESFEQLDSTIDGIVDLGINVIRAGVWKPRTRPNSFEGNGEQALQWLNELKKKYPIKVATEVASTQHVELALKYSIDILWIGARTTVNPFGVQEIANAIKGVNIPVYVKNPVNPDLSLWIGAVERISGAGITDIKAIHRGFSSFQKTRFRNAPMWQIPIDFKRRCPEIPLICDPSHISGNREMLFEISQKSLDLNYDGLMIETHYSPDEALSDAEQQITPKSLGELLNRLSVRKDTSDNIVFKAHLEDLRDKVDHLDREIIEAIAARMKVVEEIGEYKKENDVTILQLERYKEILKTRPEWGQILELDPKFVMEFYKLVHEESIRKQTDIFNNIVNQTKNND